MLSKLVHIVQLPLSKMNDQLNKTIHQWLPFGRPNGQQQLELLNKPATTQKSMWLRSKPKIEVQVKEEVRMVASSRSVKAEVYGTVYFILEQDVDCSHSIRLELGFSKLPGIPSALFHPSVIVHWEKTNCTINIQQLLEKTFPLCHYNFTLEVPPIQPILKIRMEELGKVSIFIQLHISATTRNTLNRLEIRLPMPTGNRIARILAAVSPGLVSIVKDGSLLLWNLSPLSSSSNSKLKEDMTLSVDIVMERLDACLANAQALVRFDFKNLTYLSMANCFLLCIDHFHLCKFYVWSTFVFTTTHGIQISVK